VPLLPEESVSRQINAKEIIMATGMKGLTADRVGAIFNDCMFRKEELPPKEYVPASGIITDVGFHPERVESYKDEIAEMLAELSDDFQEAGGGGMSFLKACEDKHGNQWTGMHQTMEQLFQLGMAVGKVTCQLPREAWELLPGGMPYYVVNNNFNDVYRQAA
jgi:hypothetical protein